MYGHYENDSLVIGPSYFMLIKRQKPFLIGIKEYHLSETKQRLNTIELLRTAFFFLEFVLHFNNNFFLKH